MIDSEEYAVIRGNRQNIRVVGESESNPVILFLHGGPGVCDRHIILKYHASLARDFTLVCWDQRGSGKSYDKRIKKEPLSVEDYVLDAECVTDLLRERFGKEKIIVAGHSWGTVVGTLLTQRCPEKIAAYIGQGQFVDGPENERLSYEFCVAEAEKRGEKKALEILKKYPPDNGVYPCRKGMMTQRDCLTRYGGGDWKERAGIIKSLVLPVLRSKEYGLRWLGSYAAGASYLSGALWSQVVRNRFGETVKRMEMPVLFTQGRHDYNTPSALAEAWFDALEAPRKEFVWFEDSAHSPDKEEPEKWEETVRSFCLSL